MALEHAAGVVRALQGEVQVAEHLQRVLPRRLWRGVLPCRGAVLQPLHISQPEAQGLVQRGFPPEDGPAFLGLGAGQGFGHLGRFGGRSIGRVGPGRQQGPRGFFQLGAGLHVLRQPGLFDGFGLAGLAARRCELGGRALQLAAGGDLVQEAFHRRTDARQCLAERGIDVCHTGVQGAQGFVLAQGASLAKAVRGLVVVARLASGSSVGNCRSSRRPRRVFSCARTR